MSEAQTTNASLTMKPAILIKTRPILSLTLLFIAWKLLILLIVLLSPGVGYDTSTSLLLHPNNDNNKHDHHFEIDNTPDAMQSRLLNLVRWDAIYYVHMAKWGHVFEQEWAFGVGLSRTVAWLTRCTFGGNELRDYVLVGVVLSHFAHWCSVVLLWGLASRFFGGVGGKDQGKGGKSKSENDDGSGSRAFVAAALHVISPGGVFLSAPYAEGFFSGLSMLGYYLYVRAREDKDEFKGSAVLNLLLSGMAFGCATVVRSNGVLNGLPFLLDAASQGWMVLSPRTTNNARVTTLLDLVLTVFAGSCIAVGMFIPQFMAYQDYCTDREVIRPWCSSMPPSIFTWVQSHYWNVGFLRYWTLSNVPLFLLATPMLFVLTLSGVDGCNTSRSGQPSSRLNSFFASRLALPQLVLAVLALTSYHVQIITRLSSGSPFWYLWLATNFDVWKYSRTFVRIMVIYGLVQACLYASFLPPA